MISKDRFTIMLCRYTWEKRVKDGSVPLRMRKRGGPFDEPGGFVTNLIWAWTLGLVHKALRKGVIMTHPKHSLDHKPRFHELPRHSKNPPQRYVLLKWHRFCRNVVDLVEHVIMNQELQVKAPEQEGSPFASSGCSGEDPKASAFQVQRIIQTFSFG